MNTTWCELATDIMARLSQLLFSRLVPRIGIAAIRSLPLLKRELNLPALLRRKNCTTRGEKETFPPVSNWNQAGTKHQQAYLFPLNCLKKWMRIKVILLLIGRLN